jgi:CRP/FNR family transcriptional activator FtrB
MSSPSRFEGSQLPFLAQIGRSGRDELLTVSTILRLSAGRQVLAEGDLPGYLLFPLDAPIELYARCGSKAATIALSPVQQPFILAAVVKDAPCLMSARTIAPTRILYVPAKRFRTVLRNDPALAVATAQELSRAFRTMVRQVRWQKLRTAKMRLAAYLICECCVQSGPAQITLEIPKRLLASLLGLEPESLSRSFASLSSHGVHVTGNLIAISDAERLRSIANFDDTFDEE